MTHTDNRCLIPGVGFVAMFKWWNVVPDEERLQWTLDPLLGVGLLRFDMSPDEVSRAVSSVTTEQQRRKYRQPAPRATDVVVEGDYRKCGLRLYYREERLAGVVVDALGGPQVFADGMALVGRVPSVLEQWMIDRAEADEPHSELSYMDAGVPGLDTLGVVIDVQRAGDHLLTRPVFIPPEALDDLPHWLPREAWSAC